MLTVYLVGERARLVFDEAVFGASTTVPVASFQELVRLLLKRGNDEWDSEDASFIVLDTETLSASDLEALSFEDKKRFVQFFFSHLSAVVAKASTLRQKNTVSLLQLHFGNVRKKLAYRSTRMQTWTEAGIVPDVPAIASTNPLVPTMSGTLSLESLASDETICRFYSALNLSIDFFGLLSNSSPSHLSKLCHDVGHWAFPAHELSNDDLAYCTFLMLKYVIVVVGRTSKKHIRLPSDNELLALIFMTRDAYRNGNPFHNFRHAVDVLQACFQFLVRLRSLPEFDQFEQNATAEVQEILQPGSHFQDSYTELVTDFANIKLDETSLSYLTPQQCLALLVAALGHDVGHPGVTNAFLIKHDTPAAKVFSGHSVLELFHAKVFINRILTLHWPDILSARVDLDSDLTMNELIGHSILATDMAEHFGYLQKFEDFKVSAEQGDLRVRLIMSLLIKCADISNVTRPPRVSSQWAMVLSREFEEVTQLEKYLAGEESPQAVSYEKVPEQLDTVLQKNPSLHAGQLFFITTFAEGLFNNVSQLLPRLKFTSEILAANKAFWTSRAGAA